MTSALPCRRPFLVPLTRCTRSGVSLGKRAVEPIVLPPLSCSLRPLWRSFAVSDLRAPYPPYIFASLSRGGFVVAFGVVADYVAADAQWREREIVEAVAPFWNVVWRRAPSLWAWPRNRSRVWGLRTGIFVAELEEKKRLGLRRFGSLGGGRALAATLWRSFGARSTLASVRRPFPCVLEGCLDGPRRPVSGVFGVRPWRGRDGHV